MSYQQVKDVIQQIRQAHQLLRDILEQPRHRAKDSRTRKLLEALREEEQQLQIILAKYQKQADQSLLNSWLQFTPDEELCRTISSIGFSSDMTVDEVVEHKFEFDQALIRLLRQFAESVSAPRVHEFFADLAEYHESTSTRQGWKVREFQGNSDPPMPDNA